MPGYTNRVVRYEFPELSHSGEQIYVVLRNCRRVPLEMLTCPEDVPAGEKDRLCSPGREVISRIVVDWHVYDAGDPNPDQAALPLPATPKLVAQILQIGWYAEIGDTKTDNGRRTIALTPPADIRALRRHRLTAEDEASTHGGWPDTGLVFTNPDGTALHPATVTGQFHLLAKEAALPPVRLHDVRHGAATHALATGVEMKVVSDILGHATTTTITADIYTSVIDDLKKTAATKIADHIGFNPDDAVEL